MAVLSTIVLKTEKKMPARLCCGVIACVYEILIYGTHIYC